MISYEGIQRLEKFPYPVTALREAVTNAVTHKNYSGATPIQIKVYEDKIVIWNDAILPENWTIEIMKMSHPSKPYNPDIANAMFRAGLVEAWGRGTIEILHDCQSYGLREPEFAIDVTGFQISFFANTLGEMSGKVSGKVSGKILDFIRINPSITIPELAGKIGVTERTIQRTLQSLQKDQLIKRLGGRKIGYWEIIED